MQQNVNLFKNVSKFCFVKKPNIKNSEILYHFGKEGISRNTIYNNLKRLETGQPFSDKKHSGCQHSGLQKRKPN